VNFCKEGYNLITKRIRVGITSSLEQCTVSEHSKFDV
jgi:hypothetical protein